MHQLHFYLMNECIRTWNSLPLDVCLWPFLAHFTVTAGATRSGGRRGCVNVGQRDEGSLTRLLRCKCRRAWAD